MEPGPLCNELKPHILPIRRKFEADEVEIAYEDRALIGAYMLLYFPNYAVAAHNALTRIAAFLRVPRTSVAYCCGGSLPELLGSALVLQNMGNGDKTLQATIFDKYIQTWTWTHGIAFELTRLFAPNVQVNLESRQVDFLEAIPEATVAAIAANDLVLFQHCLNEFAGDVDVLERIASIGHRAAVGTTFLFLDRDKYATITRAMRGLRERFVAAGYEVIEDCENPYPFHTPNFFLAEAKDAFFDGIAQKDADGSWLPGQYRASTLNLRALVMRKVR